MEFGDELNEKFGMEVKVGFWIELLIYEDIIYNNGWY